MHNEVVELINGQVSGANATLVTAEVGDSSVFVESSHILNVCKELKNSRFDFNVLQVMTGTDYEDRIEVSYILASFTNNHELILKVKLPKTSSDAVPEIDSVTSVWKAANYQERECYDMVGVKFNGHPDLRRILCCYDWEGYPLRKDYVAAEKYHDMLINPPEKMNSGDHFFYKEVEGQADDPKKVTHSWKD